MTQIPRFLTPQQEANCGVAQKIMDMASLWQRAWFKTATQEEKDESVAQFYQLCSVLQYFVDRFTDELYDEYKIKKEKYRHKAWE